LTTILHFELQLKKSGDTGNVTLVQSLLREMGWGRNRLIFAKGSKSTARPSRLKKQKPGRDYNRAFRLHWSFFWK